MGLANDHLGYLLTAAEMKKGGYEAGMSFFGDDFGETLAQELCGLTSALRAAAGPAGGREQR
jgi:hypothetical protein